MVLLGPLSCPNTDTVTHVFSRRNSSNVSGIFNWNFCNSVDKPRYIGSGKRKYYKYVSVLIECTAIAQCSGGIVQW